MLRATARFLHGELERNWACHEDPYYLQRKENISQMATRSHRFTENIMLETARAFPGSTSLLLRRSVKPASGLRLAGAGSAHTVLTDENNVWKIHRQSSFMSETSRHDLAEHMRIAHNILVNYLGSMVLSQTTDIAPNPLNEAKRAVYSKQKFVDFTDPKLFDGYSPIIDPVKVNTLEIEYPGVHTELKDFAKQSLRMYNETGRYIPDTSGLNNIVMVNNQLSCLDGLPFVDPKPIDRTRVLSQLHSLQSVLQ